MSFSEPFAPLTEFRRLVRIAGLLALLMVGLPLLLQRGVDSSRLPGWALASIVFALTSWYSAGAERRRALVLFFVQVACVLAMVLLLCDGFEGALLVVVALQLGGRVSRREGIAWVAVQSALLALAISIHWSPRPAMLLVPPYLGFGLLAFFVADVLARDAAARALVEENSRLAERLRIARELHDVVGHRLTALSINLEVASRTAEAATIRTSCWPRFGLGPRATCSRMSASSSWLPRSGRWRLAEVLFNRR